MPGALPFLSSLALAVQVYLLLRTGLWVPHVFPQRAHHLSCSCPHPWCLGRAPSMTLWICSIASGGVMGLGGTWWEVLEVATLVLGGSPCTVCCYTDPHLLPLLHLSAW